MYVQRWLLFPYTCSIRNYAIVSGNISRSRWTSENLFILFESTYIGAVFVIKISAGNHIVLAGEGLNNTENSSFHEMPFWVTRTGGLVTSFIISSYGNKDTI